MRSSEKLPQLRRVLLKRENRRPVVKQTERVIARFYPELDSTLPCAHQRHVDAWRAEEGKVLGDAVMVGHGVLLVGFRRRRYVTESEGQGVLQLISNSANKKPGAGPGLI